MPLQATSGAASYDAFGGGVAAVPNYIEDVFSTWLYPSISGDNQIVNNIDLSGKGGLVWIKSRDRASNHYLIDTVRGSSVGDTKSLSSNTTTAQTSGPNLDWVQFNNNGFTAKAVAGGGELGTNTYYGNMASWTFREQPKFFDVVTYTGDASSPRTISHNLGSTPGCIIIKRTDTTGDWWTYHNSLTVNQYLKLNTTAALATSAGIWGSGPTSTGFTVNVGALNASGGTYVAYLFAHNAGGFGLTGTDNVISCGSFSSGSPGNNTTVNLGYEPQWIIFKNTQNGSEGWWMYDTMRGWTGSLGTAGDKYLFSNSSGAEGSITNYINVTSTGFVMQGGAFATDQTFIYIAIRRGPMKVPTDGTKVFNVVSQTPSGTTTVTNSFASDMVLSCQRSNGGGWGFNVADKLRGSSIASGSRYLTTPTTAAEGNFAGYGFNLTNTNVQENFWNSALGVSTPVVYEIFRRAPGFFDEVCYTGNGTAGTTVTHNLDVVPELMIVKSRSGAFSWQTYHVALGPTKAVFINANWEAFANSIYWNDTAPTDSNFTLGGSSANNGAGVTYVSYLFASCPGVSKVFNYTGNGSSQTINCGFTGGARFVMIKRTDSTGDWYVWDSARGIVSGNDPRLSLNTTAAEVTTDDSVDTDSTGFVVNQLSATNINVSSATYIGIAIA